MPTLTIGTLFSIFFSAAIVISSGVPARASDSTIPCNLPPDKGASVAVHPGTQVSSTQDHQNHTCSFAINGAVATSPPPQQVLNAINLFRDPSRRFIQNIDASAYAVAALLAAPSPVDEVPMELSTALKNPKLDQCLKVFFGSNELPTERSDDGAFSCKGLRPYADARSKAEMLASTGIAVGVPTLMISLKWQRERFTSVAYLPIDMVGLPLLRTP